MENVSKYYLLINCYITGDEEDDDSSSDDHQTSIELSYPLSENSSCGNRNSQPHPPVQDPVTPTKCFIKEACHGYSSLHCSTPIKEQPFLSLYAPATPTQSADSSPRETKSPPLPLTIHLPKTFPLSISDDVIDLTQSDEDSDITYCSSVEGDVYIDSEVSLNPTTCDHCAATTAAVTHNTPSSSQLSTGDHCVILPATPEHSTVRTTSIVLSYHGTL